MYSELELNAFLFNMQMIFPWLFDEVHALRPFKDAAQLLAEKKDWPSLYDIAALKDNKVRHISVKVDMLGHMMINVIRCTCINQYLKDFNLP